ncbi:MAG TPA: polysaccharide pyruvyl transferase family protein [Gemmatimonadaceae bacterium]|nr:polysaccharide pyruvyl transferase family protein [Gemmatimonadaceae bacterium]
MHPLVAADTLRARLEETLRPLVTPTDRVALIDFPNYPNVGDSAIYLGELACLASLRVPFPRYICDIRTYDRTELAHRLGSAGVILLAGGGTFGDLWPASQELREEIVRSFPGNRIIQLPQTIHFEQRQALQRARGVLNAHRQITLLVRDARSLEIARTEFGAPSLLSPDAAFALGALARPAGASHERLWLLRTDKESRGGVTSPTGEVIADWLDEPAMWRRRLSYALMGAVRRKRLAPLARPLLMRLYAPLARQRLARGLDLLASGRVVITDRLHAHILCVLMGVSHVLLDNSYGKLSSFHETWTAEVDNVRWAHSPAEALRLAEELAGTPTRATSRERARG